MPKAKPLLQSAWVTRLSVLILLALLLQQSLILMDALGRPVYEAFSEWVRLHRVFFFVSPILCLIIALTDRAIFQVSGWALLFSWVLERLDYFDSTLHPFLNDWGVYRGIGLDRAAGNPQFSILLFFGVGLFAQLLRLAFRQFRGVDHWMAVLLVVANLGAVGLCHRAFPDGFLKVQCQDLSRALSRLALLRAADLQKECLHWEVSCRILAAKKMPLVLSAPEIENPKAKERYEVLKSMSAEPPFEEINTNQAPSVFHLMKTQSGDTLEIFATVQPQRFWQLNVGYLYSTAFMVAAAWFLALSILSWVHRKVRY